MRAYLKLSRALGSISIITGWWFWNRNEDQEVVAYRRWITPIGWLDGERFSILVIWAFWRFIFYWLCLYLLSRCLGRVAEEIFEDAHVLHMWICRWSNDWGILRWVLARWFIRLIKVWFSDTSSSHVYKYIMNNNSWFWWRSCVTAVSFSYSDSDSQDVSMNISLTGTKKHGGVQC